jgi:hypothetical protein
MTCIWAWLMVLARRLAFVQPDVETVRSVFPFEQLAHFCDQGPHLQQLVLRQLEEQLDMALGDDQRVALGNGEPVQDRHSCVGAHPNSPLRQAAKWLGVILQYLTAQIAAGAKAIIICEPAANKVYFSPNQLAKGYEVFDRFVMEPNRRIKELLTTHGADLIFHDCGELLDGMVRRFTTLDPVILSLGSSRKLWDDAALVPKSTILYGFCPPNGSTPTRSLAWLR